MGGTGRGGWQGTAHPGRYRQPRRYWLVVLLGAVFTLARFSEAFLVLRAQNVWLGLGYVPLVMVVKNLFYAGPSLWGSFGAAVTFLACAPFTMVAARGLLTAIRRRIPPALT